MNQDSIRLEEREGQGRPYISRAARDLNRAGRSTCIITLNHGEGGSMTPLPHILGVACFLNRAGSAMCAKLSFSFEKIEA